MSSVVLQVGQCGNQIGREFWKYVDEEENIRPSNIWRHHDRHFRSVNTDTEPKVLRKLTLGFGSGKLNGGAGRFSPDNLIASKIGRGSNWAMGYHGKTDGGREDVFTRTMEALRREIEICESFQV